MIYKLGKHKIWLYDSIHELPILRFQRFNKYQMEAIEIGNSFQDYDAKTRKVIDFMKHEMIDEAVKELENTRLTVFNAFNEFSPEGKSFALMVRQIDNVVYDKFDSDSLNECLNHLEKIGMPNGIAKKKLVEVKKKSKRNYKFTILNILKSRKKKNKQS